MLASLLGSWPLVAAVWTVIAVMFGFVLHSTTDIK